MAPPAALLLLYFFALWPLTWHICFCRVLSVLRTSADCHPALSPTDSHSFSAEPLPLYLAVACRAHTPKPKICPALIMLPQTLLVLPPVSTLRLQHFTSSTLPPLHFERATLTQKLPTALATSVCQTCPSHDAALAPGFLASLLAIRSDCLTRPFFYSAPSTGNDSRSVHTPPLFQIDPLLRKKKPTTTTTTTRAVLKSGLDRV